MGREGRVGSSSQRWGRTKEEDAYSLPGDDDFGLPGENEPYTNVSSTKRRRGKLTFVELTLIPPSSVSFCASPPLCPLPSTPTQSRPSSRDPAPHSSSSRPQRARYDHGDMHDEETMPYAQSRDDLRGPSMKTSSRYSNDEMPTFDTQDARRAKHAASPVARFKSERPPERELLTEQMFRELEVSL
jgi:hypothetical protein